MARFKIFDPIIGALAGGCIAFAVSQLVPAHWNLFAGMIVGSVAGMTLKFVLMIPLIPFFGAFQVMIPLSIIGMLTGMLGGMAAAMGSVPDSWITAGGATLGLAVSALVLLSDKNLTQPK